ncbi:hypothetical protein F511_37878 [Dorcoceras hygrometricum]|uniref:Uncharacterized protein n=1 Tax=Dorcoceras hygrometricum TaxID=472368 RepID=A0A2Z7CQ15_9LAMI|nr:hypothetical protein F511_37878 [Dorcoceras hygrometricum]
MKIEFRLLNDILAKTVTAKAGSFDDVTHEMFLLMTAIHGGIKINWSRLLFNILKEMVTPSSKQARGFAVQLCILLKGAPGLTMGDSKHLEEAAISEAVQTRESIDELKAEKQKITRLELAFAQSTSRQDMVFRAQINDVLREVQVQKAVLTQELTAFHWKLRRASLLFVPNSQKSLPISIEGVMTKRGKEVVVVRSLKVKADLDLEVVEVATNLLKEEVDLIEEVEVEVLVLADGFLEIFLFSSCT